MKSFKVMDTETIQKLLEGQENVLGPLVHKEQAFFKTSECPLCKSLKHEQFTDAERPFTPGAPLPTTRLHCLDCHAEFDPYSGMVTKVTPESDLFSLPEL